MTYDETTALFEAMDGLDRNARLLSRELAKDVPIWESVDRYQGYIKDHRRAIFDVTQLHGS